MKSAIKPISLEAIIESATLQSWRDAKILIMLAMGFTLKELLTVTEEEMPLFIKLKKTNMLHPVFVYALSETKREEQLNFEKKAFLDFLKSN